MWEQNDHGSITADTYVRYIFLPIMWPFIMDRSHAQGRPMEIWSVEDGAAAHRAEFTEEH